MIIPRPYQNRAASDIWHYFYDHTGNPICAMPTGTGKSLVIGMLITRMLKEFNTTRVIVATHVKELIKQDVKALMQMWASAPYGVNSAGLNRRDTIYPIIFGGIGSIYKSAQQLGKRDILFIDECHLVSPKENSMYQQLVNDLKVINPMLKVIGFSATPYRMGQGLLTDEGLFTDIACDLTTYEEFNYFIDHYYLCPLIPKPTDFEYDTSGIRVTGEDFNQQELQISVDNAVKTRKALGELYELGRDRKKWLIFSTGVAHAEHIGEELNRMGVTNAVLTNKTTSEQRRNILAAYKEGLFTALVNNSILVAGFDEPGIDLIGDMGPTLSTGKHVQKYGRGTRPVYHPSYTPEMLENFEMRKKAFEEGGKPNCLVADFAGNAKTLGPINDPVLPRKKGKGGGLPPLKICDNCGAYEHISVRICGLCGAEFTFRCKIQTKSGTTDIIKRDIKTSLYNVTRMFYAKHQKPGKPPTLKVSYFVKNTMIRQWLGFDPESHQYSRHLGHKWWRQCANDKEPAIPTCVDEALMLINQGAVRQPKKIEVLEEKGKLPEVTGLIF